jgi:hypothetical protein
LNVISDFSARSTKLKRQTVWRHFIQFWRHSLRSFDPLDPPQLHICLFIVYLFKRRLCFNTVRSYLFSLAVELKLRGGNNFFEQHDAWFVHTTMKYYKRLLGTRPLTYRRPITLDYLPKIIGLTNLSILLERTLFTMIVIGIFGCFRVGELCGHGQTFIRNKDVVFRRAGVVITLWNSKTDKEKKGIKKFISDVPSSKFNPYNLMKSLAVARTIASGPNDPFFCDSKGKCISRFILVKFIQKVMHSIFPHIPISEWNGISLRKGGATTAMRAGVNNNTIQRLGHWESNIYRSYVDVDFSDIAQAQSAMASWGTSI